MTASQAAEFARAANVDELILIHFASRYAGRYGQLVDEARAIFPNVSADFPADLPKNRPRHANRS
jgi:ribonuclease Z